MRFEWLLALSPRTKTVLIPYTPGDKSSEFSRVEAFFAAQAGGVRLIEEPVTGETGLLALLERHKKEIGAIFIPRDSSVESHIATLVQFADKNRLPLAVPGFQQVEQGALFTYGFIHTEMGKQAAGIASRIFGGEHPASLPVESAKNYLVINLDTAKKIGLAIPDSVRAGADRLIGGDEAQQAK
jgi:putative ABC transport system substrate-binding protein